MVVMVVLLAWVRIVSRWLHDHSLRIVITTIVNWSRLIISPSVIVVGRLGSISAMAAVIPSTASVGPIARIVTIVPSIGTDRDSTTVTTANCNVSTMFQWNRNSKLCLCFIRDSANEQKSKNAHSKFHLISPRTDF